MSINYSFFKHSLKPIIKNTAILSMCIFVFFVVLNLIYGFLIRKNSKKTEEMELILARKSRLNEIGSLVTGINHQLKQPLNSLNLAISNSELLLQKNYTDIEMLLKNMSICKNQINLMNKTINIFRSFYSPNEDISEFCLNETIKSIIYTTNSQFFKHNITVKFEENDKIFANSIENFIQQILLVLLQNSKDAILEKKDIVDKNIYINIEKFDKDAAISISDFGIGIDARQAKNIFNANKASSKKLGFGFGLYFSKILSIKKLGGDLVLENHKNPTKFSLKIPLNIRK